MAGQTSGPGPEGARPFLEILAQHAKEALKPLIEDATRRVTAEMVLKDAESIASLAAKTQQAITTAYWNHPARISSGIGPGIDLNLVMGAMATAAVDVFLDYLRTVPVPKVGDGENASEKPE